MGSMAEGEQGCASGQSGELGAHGLSERALGPPFRGGWILASPPCSSVTQGKVSPQPESPHPEMGAPTLEDGFEN